MATLTSRLKNKLTSRKGQLTVFAGVAAATALLVGMQVFASQGVSAGTAPRWKPGGSPAPTVSGVTVGAKLSQTKLVQGQDGTVYVNLSIHTPQGHNEQEAKAPTDFVVVLDRSPSMLAANKFPFAKTAVVELINKLDEGDRLGLIAFDRRAQIYSELVDITPRARQRLIHLVNNLTVGSATNIGDGLIRARALIEASPSHRVKKILLLSDGETNRGITDPNALARMASDISSRHIVLSTIGMGLGFNEALMASLADHGMGNYSYLEHLNTLGHILAKDLEDTHLIYAANSELRLQLHDGVKLVDAAGYPVEKIGRHATYIRIKTGQLLRGSHKTLVLTLNSPTATPGDFSLGDIAWQFSVDGQAKQATVERQQLAYAVVEPAKKKEAMASISKKVYRKSWLRNNLGRMRQKFYQQVKEGNKNEAQAVVDDYRRELRKAEEDSGLSIRNQKLDKDLAEMETGLEDAFSGAPAVQAAKRNSFSKSMQSRSRDEQRK
jgi:Ca-activated chloride channel family protein